MAIFCFCSHYQSMIRRMITWQISAWKPFPASLFRLGWNSILAFSACFPRLKIFQLALSNWAGMFNSGWISGQTETFSMESPIWFQKNFFWCQPPKRLIIPLHGVGRVFFLFFFGIGCPVTAWLPSNLKMWATMQPWSRVHSVWNRLIWNSSRNINLNDEDDKWWSLIIWWEEIQLNSTARACNNSAIFLRWVLGSRIQTRNHLHRLLPTSPFQFLARRFVFERKGFSAG